MPQEFRMDSVCERNKGALSLVKTNEEMVYIPAPNNTKHIRY